MAENPSIENQKAVNTVTRMVVKVEDTNRLVPVAKTPPLRNLLKIQRKA
jgi:hypothetical protein